MKGKLKVNLHLTQACNYHCRHCFAMFPEPRDLSPERWKDIISGLAESGLVGAINFAGGEPVFCRGFPEIVSFAHEKGFLLSIITNGSLLRNEKLFPRELFPMLSMFGFSIDSLNYDTLRRIGRYDSRGNILGRRGFIDTARLIRELSPSAAVKINTVVSKLNWNERLVDIEEEVPVSRWKFLKMKVFETKGFSNRDLAVTESEFESFVRNNRRRYGETVVESTMERSYLIIDNAGNLLDNRGDSYTIIGNLLEEPFGELLSRFAISRNPYAAEVPACMSPLQQVRLIIRSPCEQNRMVS